MIPAGERSGSTHLTQTKYWRWTHFKCSPIKVGARRRQIDSFIIKYIFRRDCFYSRSCSWPRSCSFCFLQHFLIILFFFDLVELGTIIAFLPRHWVKCDQAMTTHDNTDVIPPTIIFCPFGTLIVRQNLNDLILEPSHSQWLVLRTTRL